VLWEWGLNRLAPDSELLVSELVTNAVKATAGRDEAAVRLRLSGDSPVGQHARAGDVGAR
jgi:hypothetical protein